MKQWSNKRVFDLSRMDNETDLMVVFSELSAIPLQLNLNQNLQKLVILKNSFLIGN